METPPGRRYRIVSWRPELLLCMGSGTFEVIENALPPDAQVIAVSAGHGPFSAIATVDILVWSASFDEVPEGAAYPQHDPHVIRRLSTPLSDRPDDLARHVE